MNIDQTIDENLKYIKDLIVGIAETDEEGEGIWYYYRSVISEMMKEYARQAIDCVVDKRMELFHTWQGGQVYKNEEAIEKLKEELI